MVAPVDDHTPAGVARPRKGRAVGIPTAELRQGLRLAVLHSATAVQRAETVRDLVEEMVDATATAAEATTIAEIASCAAVSDAVAAHVERVRQLHTDAAPPMATERQARL